MASEQASPARQQDSDSIADELGRRIRRDIDHYGGALPERFALAWAGYLAAMLEWGLIKISAYDRLTDLLPRHGSTDEDPILAIFLGRDDDANSSD